MSTVPSPAELWWRIRWLAGPPYHPNPSPHRSQFLRGPKAPTSAEIEPPRRSRLRESIRVELHREAQRVYVTAQQEVDRRIVAAYSAPPAQLGRCGQFGLRCVECQRQRRHSG